MFDHFAFQVSDMDAAIDFYVKRLEFTLLSQQVDEAEQETFAFLSLGDLRLELLRDLKVTEYVKPEVKPPYCPHLAIRSDDIEKTVASLQANGVEILRGPLKIEGQVTWLYFLDPDNNVIEYVQWFQ